jgi:ABC-2 type transport system ATP-binding protein
MIETRQLTKRYGDLTAVDNISFKVETGQVLGFLGPNGAGKSTTMKMIAGFLAPTSGTISVCGHDVTDEPLQAKGALGYLPEGAPSYGEMSVAEFLDFIADIRGLGGEQRSRRREDVIGRLHLEPVLGQSIETLSKGFKRRVGLAQAILHDPPVLVLDEPTDGLDPNQKHEVRKLIHTMAEDKALILSTHILEEVDAVCTRAVIIARGRIVADARPDELKRRSEWHNAVRLTFNVNLLPRIEQLAAGVRGVQEVRPLGKVNGVASLLCIPADGTPVTTAVGDAVRQAGVEIDELVVEQGRLDDVFRDLTAGVPDAPGVH